MNDKLIDKVVINGLVYKQWQRPDGTTYWTEEI